MKQVVRDECKHYKLPAEQLPNTWDTKEEIHSEERQTGSVGGKMV